MKQPMMIFVATVVAVCGMCLTASAEDAYIESYGTGSICLGHRAGPNTKIEVDLELMEILAQARLFGCNGDNTSTLKFRLYLGDLGSSDPRQRFSWECSDVDGSRMAWNMDVAATNERRTISFDAPTRTYASIPHGAATGYSYTFAKAVLNKTSSNPIAVLVPAIVLMVQVRTTSPSRIGR